MARFIVSRLGVPAINKDWYSTSDEEAIQKKNISTIVQYFETQYSRNKNYWVLPI